MLFRSDESRYDDPDRFDLRRERIPHASFGFGTHYCSGHAVTRPFEEIALEEILRGLPGLRLDPAADPAPDLRGDITNRVMRTVPLAFDPPAAA